MLRNPVSVALLAIFWLLASSAPGAAANLVSNAGFDENLDSWTLTAGSDFPIDWSPQDVAGSPQSGSVRLRDRLEEAHTFVRGAHQCIPVVAGESYDFGAWARVPSGQDREGETIVQVTWYASSECDGPSLDRAIEFITTSTAGWELLGRENQVAPAGSLRAKLELLSRGYDTGGTFTALFDDAHLCTDGDCTAPAPPGPPAPPYASWIRTPNLPGFEAQVRITPEGQAPFEGSEEDACVPETICARGALPGRPEIFAKVIGPRPNGYLWVQLIRFTPSRVEVWLRQVSTLEVRYYVLDSVPPGAGMLSGLEDRTAFQP